MSIHESHVDECDHEMRFCKQCGAAYCRKCSREWKDCKLQHYPYNWHYSLPTTVTQSASPEVIWSTPSFADSVHIHE